MTGPGEGTRAGRGHLRAAQADREQAITVLKAAYAQGRLTKDELELRAGQAFASKTYAELAALTADIPAVSPAGSPAVSPAGRPPSTPARTLAKAACRSGVCLLAAVALAEGSFLVGNFLLIVAACFALIAASGFFGYGILDAWQERRSRGQLPPKPGQGSDGRPPGDDAPPGGISWTRADPARADETRADGTRADVRRHSASVTLAPPYGPLWMPLLLLKTQCHLGCCCGRAACGGESGSVSPAPPYGPVWMPPSCCSSDVDGASTSFRRAGLERWAGVSRVSRP